jgi:SAM-dependent methyltransferase
MTLEQRTPGERDYVLGTHDEEIERLGLQHRVWRPRASDAWRRAGFTLGQTLLDVGCGPGYAALDLAEIAGPDGRVIGVDRSRRFLDVAEARARHRGLTNLELVEMDLDESELPSTDADGAWARWVVAFVRRPRDLVGRIHEALRPGGSLVMHEYVHYQTWRLAPRCREHEEFVQLVIESWRENGGEPDVGIDLPRWLVDRGFAIEEMRTFADVIGPEDYAWQWPMAFIGSGLRRLVTLGKLSRERAADMERAIVVASEVPNTWFVLPAVVEIRARRI